MPLLSIKDPIKNHKSNDSSEKDIAIGIDLGTTNSAVAVYYKNKVIVVEDETGSLTPSVVSVLKGYLRLASNTKMSYEKSKDITIFKSIKRLMGKSLPESKDLIAKLGINVDISNDNSTKLNLKSKNCDKVFTPEEISATILSYLKSKAEKFLNKKIDKAVITVPAYFDELSRNSTKNAGKIAGLEVLRLINEPTSAALAYGLDEGIEGTYLVYDFGGGTFDASLLKLKNGVFRVLSTSGDNTLGGDDIDYLIVDKILNVLNIKQYDSEFRNYLKTEAKKLKHYLSTQDEYTVNIEYMDTIHDFKFTRKMLEDTISNLVIRTLSLCISTLKDGGINSSDLDGVILVGGSTKSPIIASEIKKKICPIIFNNIDPEKVVAIGAGYQAANLTGMMKKSLLLDVVPLSLGIETAGGIVEKIIYRNSPIPIAKAQEFTTMQDNQTAISLHVIQGERELVKDNKSLAKFSLKGIPAMTAGSARVLVEFMLDSDGILTVSAKDQSTGVRQQIEVKPSFGLSSDDMKSMIIDSMENAEQDIKNRLIQTSKVDAEMLIQTLENALEKDSHLINSEELSSIKVHITSLKSAVNNGSRENIEEKIKKLSSITDRFAELRVNKAIQSALKGKNIQDININKGDV